MDPPPRDEPRLPVPFVLLTGGKGGVGKTTLAANLGVALVRAGVRALLVDLDLGLANLNVLLRLPPRYNLEDYFAGERPLEDCLLAGPGGVHVLPAGSGSADMGRPDRTRRALLLKGLAELAPRYDLVLGDGAAGIGPDVLAFGCAADRVLAVTSPEPAAVTDAYGVVKALHTYSTERGAEIPTPEVVVNMARDPEEAEATAHKLRTVCERFLARSPRLAGWLPRAREVETSARTQRPFVLAAPESLATRSLERLSRRVAQLVTGPGRS